MISKKGETQIPGLVDRMRLGIATNNEITADQRNFFAFLFFVKYNTIPTMNKIGVESKAIKKGIMKNSTKQPP